MKAGCVGIWLVAECWSGLTLNVEAFARAGGHRRHHLFQADASTTNQFEEVDQGLEGGGARVCVLDSDIGDGAAADLAHLLSLPLVPSSAHQSLAAADRFCVGYTHILYTQPYECYGVRDYSLAISMLHEDNNKSSKRRKALSKRKLNPFFVDFCPVETSRLGRRLSGVAGPDQLLKAVSPRKGFPQGAKVYDLTAGWGQDSLLIAGAGAQSVHLVERNPVVACLLSDAFRRLKLLAESSTENSIQEVASSLSECLALTQGDGTTVAQQLADLENEDARPDIVYLDPMFPERKKRSSVKKNMQILHGLLSSREISVDSLQEERLLKAAYAAAKSRVVVKRPSNAPVLGVHAPGDSLIPSSTIRGPVNRWDIYAKF